MKRSELEPGMVLKLRNEVICIVVENLEDKKYVEVRIMKGEFISKFTRLLISDDLTAVVNPQFDVMKVYCWLGIHIKCIFERIEIVEEEWTVEFSGTPEENAKRVKMLENIETCDINHVVLVDTRILDIEGLFGVVI